jgi:alpha-pyrone synthase
MVLSPDVPQALGRGLPRVLPALLSDEERLATKLWAIHPGGRSVLDAVQDKLALTAENMAPSREILRRYGNMSSATLLFVLRSIMDDDASSGPGAAFAFGPGLTVESMRFQKG